MKLELKHLATYLPYELKGFCTDDLQGVEIMNGLQKISDSCIEVISDKEPMDLVYFKPILFPLSSLTKEDVKNFYQFNNDDFKSIDLKEWAEDLMFFIKTKEPFQLSQFEYLLSKKFDVFGLIELGLAEPVTEDFNPYK